MSFRRIFIPAAVLLMAAVSCESEVEFTGETKAPKAVVYCNAIDGKPLSVSISRSVFFTEYPEEYRAYADDLQGRIKSVKATFNGVEEELEMVYDPKATPPVYDKWDSCAFIYASGTKAEAGQTIDLKVEMDGYGTITSQTTVPKTPEFEILSVNENDDAELVFTLRVQDDPDTDNWYQLLLSYTDTAGYTYSTYYDSDDLVLINSNGADLSDYLNDTNLFTDELINGKSYTFKISTSMYRYYYYYDDQERPTYTWTVTLRNISRSLYYYISSRQTLDNVSGMGTFGEYATLYSNMSGGIGCLSSWSSTSDSFEY